MSRRHFGTDGVRGVANVGLTPEFAFQLGQAAGRTLRSRGLTPRVVLGRDTRRSGPMLAASLASGFCSVGVDVVALGVAPTPAVSFIARTGDFGMGAIVSASHNPAPDNGIKFVLHDGRKTPDEFEAEIEARLADASGPRPKGADIGWLESDRSVLEPYVRFLVSTVPERLDGMRLAVDAAHGAAYELAPRVLRELGAEVSVVGDRPNGVNINAEGGATKPEALCRITKELRADAGVAFDGDADRAVFSDAEGRLVNGDRTIGLWLRHWLESGKTMQPVAIGTVMSNGGLAEFLAGLGVRLERAPVGDKHVADWIERHQAPIGGEQSGHIIFPELGPTGDGIATALQVFRVLRREGKPLSAFSCAYEPWPQKLANVQVRDRASWADGPLVRAAIEDAERSLDGLGRVLVRASGTQPMVRVMVEAKTEQARDAALHRIVQALLDEAGGRVYSEVDLTHALGD
ncbi:MAG: phosphoglucosamine mutase [Fimbriimonadales bacterium]|nr:phosphoglucosamine mutase [Fimbriimonadales bacterium]